MKLSNSFSGALRTFSYFMSSGTHFMLDGVEYMCLYGKEPSAIELAYAIFANVLELDENGEVQNFAHAQKRATDSLRSYCDPQFVVDPPFEDLGNRLALATQPRLAFGVLISLAPLREAYSLTPLTAPAQIRVASCSRSWHAAPRTATGSPRRPPWSPRRSCRSRRRAGDRRARR